MIVPTDEDYQQAKRLKQTGATVEWPFKELAKWVGTTFRVHVLNVVYDTIVVAKRNRPRLSVVLESARDAQKFKDGWNFRRADQDRVREQFAAILSNQNGSQFSVEGLLVIFEAFEPVARVEANGRVTKEQLDQLKRRLANPDLWEISRAFDRVTFLFFTDTQARRYEAEGLKEAYAKEYSKLVDVYDEFGYLRKHGVEVWFDSKENFDTNYQSNWFYFYR